MTRLVYTLYASVFILAGLGSIMFAHLEMRPFLQLTLPPHEVPEGLLNNYRFLRAGETGFGTFMLLFRKEFHTDRRVNGIILGTLILFPMARLISVIVDGSAGIVFTGLFVVESVLALWLIAATHRVWRGYS